MPHIETLVHAVSDRSIAKPPSKTQKLNTHLPPIANLPEKRESYGTHGTPRCLEYFCGAVCGVVCGVRDAMAALLLLRYICLLRIWSGDSTSDTSVLITTDPAPP